MKLKDKVKDSLACCRDGRCSECKYNNWIPEMCQKVLFRDTLKVIEELEAPEQLTMDISYMKKEDNDYGYEED